MLAAAAILALSLAVLTAGAEMLVRGASGLARAAGLTSFVIGLTIVGFGTSAPEAAAGITAALRGNQDINVGNAVGSNIFNIAVILGLSALICPIPVARRTVRREVRTVILVSVLPYAALLTGQAITRWQGAAMLVLLGVFMWRSYVNGRAEPDQTIPGTPRRPRPLPDAALVLAGLGMLVVGAHMVVGSAVTIARGLDVPELTIALTVVAAGTSTPELFTSTVAALRRQADIAIGNILGSNIFNMLGIIGATSLVRPQEVRRQVFLLDLPVMILAALACLPIMLAARAGRDAPGRISRLEGALLLTGYGVYLAVLFTLAPRWFG